MKLANNKAQVDFLFGIHPKESEGPETGPKDDGEGGLDARGDDLHQGQLPRQTLLLRLGICKNSTRNDTQ